ncbi:transcription factor TFIIIB subunit brf1, partial [Coemansia nantahalensis]
SGHLTVADFRSLWLEQSADPPAFTNNRIKARRAMLALQAQAQTQALAQAQARAQQQGAALPAPPARGAGDGAAQNGRTFESAVDQAIEEEFATYLKEDSLKLISARMVRDDFAPDVSTWSDLDDDEVKNIILNEDEVQLKTELWDRENKEFVEEQERRRLARERDEGARKRRRSTRKKVVVVGATPLESAQNMLATRRLSKKINYDVLGKLLVSEDVKPKAGPAHSGMIPSGAPSRMISIAGTPAATSGYATPTQETMVDSSHPSAIDGLPAALATIARGTAETIVYEEGDSGLQSTAIELPAGAAAPAAAGTAAADGEEEDEDDEYDEYEEGGDAYADVYDDGDADADYD